LVNLLRYHILFEYLRDITYIVKDKAKTTSA
jgi:hypothetical protein